MAINQTPCELSAWLPLCACLISQKILNIKKKNLVIAYCCKFNGKPNPEKTSWTDDTKKCAYLSYCNIFSLSLAKTFILDTDVERNIEVAYLLEFILWKIHSLQEFDYFKSAIMSRLSGQSFYLHPNLKDVGSKLSSISIPRNLLRHNLCQQSILSLFSPTSFRKQILYI